jgi:S-adenosylmethionine:tRNA ribosyltransferase-isomerase
MQKSDFSYQLPENLIAQYPLPTRTASRLLLVNKATGHLTDSVFSAFIDQLRPEDLVVFNNTRVIAARLYGHKLSGGKVEMLIERIEAPRQALVHLKASKSPKAGSCLRLEDGSLCEVLERQDDLFRLRFDSALPLLELLDAIGHMPLPPYISRADDADDLSRYQTVFAQQAGAVAAPTAGLHFDEAMLVALAQKGIARAFVTLHVGSGTFRPVRVDDLSQHVI